MVVLMKGALLQVKEYKLAYYTARIFTLSIMVTATDCPLPTAKD